MPKNLPPPFHLAYPVSDLEEASRFFEEVLGCRKGRATAHWVDFDFFGHQLSLHRGRSVLMADNTGKVDSRTVPMPHFGVVLAWRDWEALALRLEAKAIAFRIEPHIRFPGEPGEQGTFFIDAPGAVALEFKAFKKNTAMFAR